MIGAYLDIEASRVRFAFGSVSSPPLDAEALECLYKKVLKAREALAGRVDFAEPVEVEELGRSADRLLRKVYKYKSDNDGRAPAQREMKTFIDLSSHDSLTPYLDELEAAGYLRRPTKRAARAYDWGGSWSPPAGRPFAPVRTVGSRHNK